MRPDFIVIAGVGRKDPAQMGLAEDDDVMEAFPPDRSYQPLRVPVAKVSAAPSGDHGCPWLQDAW